MKFYKTPATIAAVLLQTLVATVEARPAIQSVYLLEPGECSADGLIYKEGESIPVGDGVSQVCSTVDGKSSWLRVDDEGMGEDPEQLSQE